MNELNRRDLRTILNKGKDRYEDTQMYTTYTDSKDLNDILEGVLKEKTALKELETNYDIS